MEKKKLDNELWLKGKTAHTLTFSGIPQINCFDTAGAIGSFQGCRDHLHAFPLRKHRSVNIGKRMSQVILYILSELSKKLKQLMLGYDRVDGSNKFEPVVAGPAEPSASAKREVFGRSRLPTLVNVDGFGQCIAVLTSGGDAQGRSK